MPEEALGAFATLASDSGEPVASIPALRLPGTETAAATIAGKTRSIGRVFGFDTSARPLYLLTAPDALTPDAATELTAGLDIVVWLN
ncbi:MAG: hypothetical protein IID44_08800 [Planctomycetes bacterium]|nr:hypothetical protein [Planctomycetota bacterium]